MIVRRAKWGCLGLVVGVVWSMGGVGLAEELPEAMQADRYRFDARTALEAKDEKKAIRALEKFERVASERRWEFLYLYGTLLARYGDTAAAVEKGRGLLVEAAKKLGREGGPYYEAALAHYSAAEARLSVLKEKAEQAEKAASAAYARAEAAGTAAAYAEYLAAYPQGRHAAEAEEKRKKRAAEERRAGRRFRDCEACPEMVVVPAGSYLMGSPASEAGRYDTEGPVHRVTIAEPFAVGVYEVTRGQYARFVAATGHGTGNSCHTVEGDEWKKRSGRGWRNSGYEQTAEHPVVCVSWEDAQAYVRWLSEETGEAYRLLSEAEWEYVARGGTRTARYWGESEAGQCRYGNGRDLTMKSYDASLPVAACDDGYYQTAPVGSFSANGFGLHDVLGNVWEWVADCWHESYEGAPSDGGAWASGDCSRRVIRGSSWRGIPRHGRSADRSRLTAGLRYYSGGFRLARTLTP